LVPNQRILKNCSICKSKKIEDLKLNETNFIRPFKKAMTTKLGFCKNCTFLFCLNPLDDESIKKYYEKNFQLRSTDLDVVEEFVHASQSKFIDDHFSLKNKNVLEIGANTGKLLNHLKKLYSCQTYFDELNFEAVNILENIQGHKSKKALGKNKKFDVIIMRHVLEHIVDPIQYLLKIQKDLSDDGVIFIEVPDFTFLDNHNDTLLFEHVNYFSQLTLSRVLDSAGLIVIGQKFSITENYATISDRALRVIARKKPKELKSGIKKAINYHQKFRVNGTNKIMEEIIKKAGKRAKIGFYAASWWAERFLLNTNLKRINIVGFFDKDKKKQNTIYLNLKIYPPSEIHRLKPDIIFVLSSFEPQIKHDLKLLKFKGKVFGWSDLVKLTENKNFNL